MAKDPKKAATALYEAMKGFGTNEKKIIDTLAELDNETIQKVREEFSNHYHKDLIKEIKSETSGNFERALVALLMGPVEYDAFLLHDAMAGLGTNDSQLIEVLVTRHADHLKKSGRIFQQTIWQVFGGMDSRGHIWGLQRISAFVSCGESR